MSPKNCQEIQERLLRTNVDRTRPDASILAHTTACADCRRFAAELEQVDLGVHALKVSRFDRVVASTESRHRVHEMLDLWAAEEGLRRTGSRRKSNVEDAAEPWFSRWFFGGNSQSPSVATWRLVVQGVAALGLVLFFAFVVHLSMSRHQMAEQPKKAKAVPHVESQPAETAPVKNAVK